MPKYYCDYCDTYLTHDSPSVRKTHCNGRKHKENVRLYYQKWLEEQVQKLVDDTTAAFKAGKIASNPFQSSQQSSGTMIPPPATLAAGTKPPAAAAPPAAPAAGPPVGGPVPGMSLMGPPPGAHLPPMMPTMTVGIRPPMGPPIGPPMAPMGTMVSAIPMRPPVMAGGGGGPPPGKIARK